MSLKVLKCEKGVYKLNNGLQFHSIQELKAFLKGIEFAQENMNNQINQIINSAVNSIRIRG